MRRSHLSHAEQRWTRVWSCPTYAFSCAQIHQTHTRPSHGEPFWTHPHRRIAAPSRSSFCTCFLNISWADVHFALIYFPVQWRKVGGTERVRAQCSCASVATAQTVGMTVSFLKLFSVSFLRPRWGHLKWSDSSAIDNCRIHPCIRRGSVEWKTYRCTLTSPYTTYFLADKNSLFLPTQLGDMVSLLCCFGNKEMNSHTSCVQWPISENVVSIPNQKTRHIACQPHYHASRQGVPKKKKKTTKERSVFKAQAVAN